MKSILFFKVILIFSILTGCATKQSISNAHQLPIEMTSSLHTDKAIIAYFGRENNPEYCEETTPHKDPKFFTEPIQDGYYRILLGRNAQGHYLIQDFYIQTNTPQSSPSWIIDPLKLFSFSSSHIEGSAIIYRENGTIISKFTNKNNELIQSKNYYANGQIGSKFKILNNQNTKVKLWYASGKKAAIYTLNPNKEIISAQIWNEDGTETQDLETVIHLVFSLLDLET